MKHPIIMPAIMALSAALPMTAAGAEPLQANRPQDNSEPLTNEIVRLDVEARADYQWRSLDGNTDDSQTGFEGKYIMMRIDGVIMPGLTYSWRQRFNKSQDFFNSTDWIYLNYAVGRWNFQAGKEVIAIGGYEYDANPIDIYDYSVFCSNISCYGFGVSAGFSLTNSDKLTLQVAESPCSTADNRNLYSYNLMWNGSHGSFETIYSANMVEYTKGHYINYLSLGNKFKFGKVDFELDLMNRASSHQTFFFKDCSAVAELIYRPTDRWTIHGKYSYDVNHSGTQADMVVANGTELNMAGAALEFFPLMKKRHRLRLHAGCFYSWGKNGNPDNCMQGKTLFVTAGLTWDMNILNINR